MIKVDVDGPYPCRIRMVDDRDGEAISLPHTRLLELEHAIAEAKRQVLCKLPREQWHEVDPKLAGGG
jgi:hypothetical protein